MTDDELFDRLRDADPARRDARSQAPAESWLNDLVEETMSSTPASDGRRRRWLPLAAAAAVVLIAAAAGGFALSRGGDDSGEPDVAAPKTVTKLALPGNDAMGMCMAVDADALRNVDQALSGTAIEVSDDKVVLDVDTWYKGGDTDLVELTPADPSMVALIGAIEFEQGAEYLVSAADGHVNSCGFSGPKEPTLQGYYDEAFSG